MQTHFDLTDLEFEKQFEACTLNSETFSHEAHLRLAWIHVSKYGTEAALSNIPRHLQNFVACAGAKQKYNHTFTIAAIKAVSHFIEMSTSHNFKDFFEEFPKLKYHFKELISFHYKAGIFSSEIAQHEYTET